MACDYPGSVAADWPDLLAIVEAKVKPARDKDKRDTRRLRWWQYAEKAPKLYRALRPFDSILTLNCGSSSHLAIARRSAQAVFSHTSAIFAFDDFATFAILQSRVHEVWSRVFASSLGDGLRYTPSDCFETFPLPPGYTDAPALEAAGQAYHDHRAALMIARDQGMTPTYNRFHDARDEAADIVGLRRRHAAMDDAVLRAYGWDDLAERAAPVFLDDASEDDHQYRGRLFWPAAFRDELLARLLLLNAERARAEALS